MITLQQWIEQEGAEDRRRLFAAIKAEYPRFTRASLTHYIRGYRIPEFKIAEIISKVTGIPIFLLSFRLTLKYKEIIYSRNQEKWILSNNLGNHFHRTDSLIPQHQVTSHIIPRKSYQIQKSTLARILTYSLLKYVLFLQIIYGQIKEFSHG